MCFLKNFHLSFSWSLSRFSVFLSTKKSEFFQFWLKNFNLLSCEGSPKYALKIAEENMVFPNRGFKPEEYSVQQPWFRSISKARVAYGPRKCFGNSEIHVFPMLSVRKRFYTSHVHSTFGREYTFLANVYFSSTFSWWLKIAFCRALRDGVNNFVKPRGGSHSVRDPFGTFSRDQKYAIITNIITNSTRDNKQPANSVQKYPFSDTLVPKPEQKTVFCMRCSTPTVHPVVVPALRSGREEIQILMWPTPAEFVQKSYM